MAVIAHGPEVYSGVDTENLKKFLAKMLYRAICDFVNYKKSRNIKSKLLYEEARTWIYNIEADQDNDQPPLPDECPSCWTNKELCKADRYMSFETICDILGWNAEWVRVRIGRLTRVDLQRIGKNGVL